MDDRREPLRVTYPRWGWALLILAFGAMIGLLVYQARYITVQLDRQNRQLVHSRDQADIARADLRPALREIRPLVKELRPAIKDARPALRDTGELARELQRFDAPRAIQSAGALAKMLERAQAPDAIRDTGRLAASLNENQRLVELVVRGTALLRELEERGTAKDVDRVTRLLEEALPLLRDTQVVQREAFGVLRRSLDIQEKTLEHIRRIDARTGGTPDP